MGCYVFFMCETCKQTDKTLLSKKVWGGNKLNNITVEKEEGCGEECVQHDMPTMCWAPFRLFNTKGKAIKSFDLGFQLPVFIWISCVLLRALEVVTEPHSQGCHEDEMNACMLKP
jgi:hypothetical protein